MTDHKTSLTDSSKASQVVFLFLLGLWSTSQLISVLGFLPDIALVILHHSKNILGALVVSWAFIVILSQFLQRRAISFDTNLFLLALLFPFYVTLLNIIRDAISWKEVLLYWFWVTGVYLVFPVMLQDKELRRKAIKVVFWTNLLVLLVGISLGVLKGRYYVVEHGNRMIFSFLHPNYYCNSWQVIFVLGFFYAVTVSHKWLKVASSLLLLFAAIFMLLAVSRNTLVASVLVPVGYVLLSKKVPGLVKYVSSFFIFSLGLLALLYINPSVQRIDNMATGRLSIWKMTLDANLNRASAFDYLLGFGKYKIKGFPVGPCKTYAAEELARDHVDNAYLDIILQNGIIGFLLFFIPILIIMRRTRVNAVFAADDLISRQARIVLGCWAGIMFQMVTVSIIPSFGNVINIFILVFMAPMALKIQPVQPASVEEATSSLSPVRSIGR